MIPTPASRRPFPGPGTSLAVLALLALAGCEAKAPAPQPSATVYTTNPAAVATEWTVENPTEPAVPVTLPSAAPINPGVKATGPHP